VKLGDDGRAGAGQRRHRCPGRAPAALHQQLTGDTSSARVVVVDPVKATVQVVVGVDADDALTAAQRALGVTGRALHDAGQAAPATIVTRPGRRAAPSPALRSHARWKPGHRRQS